MPRSKEKAMGGEFWSDGYYASTVGKHGNERMIKKYVEAQGREYLEIHSNSRACKELHGSTVAIAI